MRGYFELELGHRAILERGADRGPESDTTELNVTALYLDVEDVADGLALRIGRQEFQDEREWLYDADLDGVRAFYAADRFTLELGAGRELLLKENLFERAPDEDPINDYLLVASYEPTDDHRLSAYTLVREGRSDVTADPIYYGLRARGAATDTLAYWLEFAHLRGRDDGDRLRGFGFDLGATYRVPGPLQFSATLGYAFGSGDPGPEGGVDRQFRQTGLQDNAHRFNGVENFRYYGEALDPELSNLGILTLGVGIRPTERSSIDLTYHLYRQDELAAGALPDARVTAETNGESRDIGQGVNLILGYQEIEDVSIRAKLGYFMPGDAFDATGDAFSVETGIEYSF